jgi:hypothetical protein
LTGGASGKLTMIGASAGEDTFLDTAALFNGDTIKAFSANSDVIDLSNLSPSSAHISFSENSANTAGTLTVSDNQGHTAAITLFGQFVAAGFHSAPDSTGHGADITYQPPPPPAVITPSHH